MRILKDAFGCVHIQQGPTAISMQVDVFCVIYCIYCDAILFELLFAHDDKHFVKQCFSLSLALSHYIND